MKRFSASQKKSATLTYFLDLFGAASLDGAVNKAVETLLPPSDPNESGPPQVDLKPILRARRIDLGPDLDRAGCRSGLLVPRGDRFVVHLRPDPAVRRRFSLAHEIGHTLFYKDDGSGQRHQVNVLARDELAVEERICDRFAAALLAPAPRVKAFVEGLADFQYPVSPNYTSELGPREILGVMHDTATHFGVSLPAIVKRLQEVAVRLGPYLLLYLRYTPNPRTGVEPALRIHDTAWLGGTEDRLTMWRYQAADRVGLRSSAALFREWLTNSETVALRSSTARLCYAIGPSGKFVATEQGLGIGENFEDISVAMVQRGTWRYGVVPSQVASCLHQFGSSGEAGKETYIVAIARFDEDVLKTLQASASSRRRADGSSHASTT